MSYLDNADILAHGVAHFARTRLAGQTPDSAAWKVVAESAELAEHSRDIGEAADVLITLHAWLAAVGHTPDELYAAAVTKMAVNNKRAWDRQLDGTYQHRKDT